MSYFKAGFKLYFTFIIKYIQNVCIMNYQLNKVAEYRMPRFKVFEIGSNLITI